MKRLLIILVAIIGVSLLCYAETFKAPIKERTSVEFTDSITGHSYEIKNETFEIFKTRTGSYYVWKTSKKSGKQYKSYLPKDIQNQIREKDGLEKKD